MVGPWTAVSQEPHAASALDAVLVLLDSCQGLSLRQKAATLRFVSPLIRLEPQRLCEAALQRCKEANAQVCPSLSSRSEARRRVWQLQTTWNISPIAFGKSLHISCRTRLHGGVNSVGYLMTAGLCMITWMRAVCGLDPAAHMCRQPTIKLKP